MRDNVRDFYPYLCRVAINSMPSWLQRRVSPEDMVQEVYLEAARSKTFDPGHPKANGWLLSVLKHKIVAEFRRITRAGREKRGREVHGKALDRHHGAGGKGWSDVELAAITNEELAAVGTPEGRVSSKPVAYTKRLARLAKGK